jgi:peptidoglycan/LPS O-acetylase OafA/YrhL
VLSAAALLAIFAVCGWQSPFYIEILQGFLGGMVAAHWVRDPVLAAVSRTTAAGLVGIAGLAAVVVGLSTAYTWQATVGLTLFFVAIASGHGLWGLLRLPGLLWLGDITYSIYLLHGLLLGAVFQHLLPRAAGMNGLVFIASAVLVDIVLVTACSLVFLKIERPGILLGKRHYRFLERLGSAMREMVAAW